MRLSTILTSLLVVAPSLAAAEGYVEVVPTASNVSFARKLLPPTNVPIAAVAQGRTIYLNHTGVTL
jgi:hypothetical protein